MKPMNVITLCVLALSLTALTRLPACYAEAAKDADEIPLAKKVADQAAALKEATTVDLPLLVKADRVVINIASRPTDKDPARQLTLSKPEDLKALRATLKTTDAVPSAGNIAATLTFIRGDKAFREIWVYDGGEWGVQRPGTSWTTGKEPELWKLVQGYLK